VLRMSGHLSATDRVMRRPRVWQKPLPRPRRLDGGGQTWGPSRPCPSTPRSLRVGVGSGGWVGWLACVAGWFRSRHGVRRFDPLLSPTIPRPANALYDLPGAGGTSGTEAGCTCTGATSSPQHRGQGVGTDMLAWVENRIRELVEKQGSQATAPYRHTRRHPPGTIDESGYHAAWRTASTPTRGPRPSRSGRSRASGPRPNRHAGGQPTRGTTWSASHSAHSAATGAARLNDSA
jgi:hypothetical protein